ncbi:cytochrome P450 [Bradyrhizobium liaoningense]|uniref:cytochrome P450 n=1 Tax=Bradyrhizobium liaoningense TaxID=43992 RepID=UPI001BA7EA1E|nr:cytochrome P450 [Bradyrhizobium liaoningense]MBR1031484.1 cytochrome P450 [Bradyrhizobium liaoningense]
MTSQPTSLQLGALAAGPRAPGPRGVRLLRLAKLIRDDRIGVLETIRRDHGDVAEIRIGPTRIVIVSDPDRAESILRDSNIFAEKGLGLNQASYFLGQGLLTSSGTAWSESRVALAGLFRRDCVQAMLAATHAAVEVELSALDTCAEGSQQLDLRPFVTRIAFATIAAEILGPHADREAVCSDLRTLSRWAERRLALPFDRLTRLAWRFAPDARRAYRRLAALIDRPDMAVGNVSDALAQHGLLDAKLLRDQTLTLLLAGHETTSAAILWTLDLLSRHPEIADRVANEARAALAYDPAAFDSKRHPHANAAVKEAMRLFPPVWVLPRRALRDTHIGPYRILAGSDVLINVHGLHRHAGVWHDPDSFIPDRFDPARPEPPAYMPFGLGARRCVGLHLGLAETVLVVAHFMARFRLMPATTAILTQAGLTLHPRESLMIRIEKRKDRRRNIGFG